VLPIRRDLFLALTAALTACHEARTTPAPPPNGESSPPAEVEALCRNVADENARVLSKATRDCPDGTEPAGGEKRLAQLGKTPAFHYCHPSGNGVWVVQLTDVAMEAPSGESGRSCGASAHYVVAWVTAGVSNKSDVRTAEAFADSTRTLEIPYQFDYDGDGRDEILVRSSDWFNGARSEGKMEVLRASPRGIEPYPVGFRYTDAVDADGDGRPDLLDADYYHAVAPCGLDGVDLDGPPLLLHALADGKFSMSDEVARRWAVTQCPNAPAPPFRTPMDAACGRLWGKSIADVSNPALVVDVCSAPDPGTVSTLVSPSPPFTTLDTATPHPFAPKKP
jgi:hypothetical protein